MGSIPGARFDITGASGSQGLLTPKSGWKVYVLPRGGYASQDSTGTVITFDSSSVASRFAANNWIQAGLATANIRLVAAVGGNSISVSGAALTVTQNDRIFVIGNTEPTVSGGSATYNTPETLIRQRDDDAADLYANSMVTSNADGLIQFYGGPAYFDCIVQDGNGTNQGSLIDLPVGAVEGISTSMASLFGATVAINGAFGITGWATFGQTVTCNAAVGITGTLVVGATATFNGAIGVTGTAAFGSTVTTTGAVVFGSTVTTTSLYGTSDSYMRRFHCSRATGLTATDFSVTLSRFGTTATMSVQAGSVDQAGSLNVTAGDSGIASTPEIVLTFRDGSFGTGGRVRGVVTCVRLNDYAQFPAFVNGSQPTFVSWITGMTPSAGQQYRYDWCFLGVTT